MKRAVWSDVGDRESIRSLSTNSLLYQLLARHLAEPHVHSLFIDRQGDHSGYDSLEESCVGVAIAPLAGLVNVFRRLHGHAAC